MKKKILYLDMDGVVADFEGAVHSLCPDLHSIDLYPDIESRSTKIDDICEENPNIFRTLKPIDGAVDAVNTLFEHYDVYFLSTPMWGLPESYTDKRIWLEATFGVNAKKKLILSHRKDLFYGEYLVDDRLKNGAADFKGEHIHFGTQKFPNWAVVLKYLINK
jgi:5'(3')-deoxyribonucleotidase